MFVLFFVIFNCLVWFVSLMLSIRHRNTSKRKDVDKATYILSISMNMIIINVGLVFFFTNFSDWLRWDLDPVSIVFDLILMSLMYDAWMYWMHRSVLHRTPAVKSAVHVEHHCESVLPCDWIHVHPVELLAQTMGFMLPVLLFRANGFAFVAFAMFKQVFEVYIHSDLECESTLDRNSLFPLLITSSFHSRHHNIGGGNYSNIFSLWDKAMGTVIKNNDRVINTKQKKKENSSQEKNCDGLSDRCSPKIPEGERPQPDPIDEYRRVCQRLLRRHVRRGADGSVRPAEKLPDQSHDGPGRGHVREGRLEKVQADR